MRKIYKILLCVLVIIAVSFETFAQQDYWSARSTRGGIITDKAVARQTFPKDFKLFDLTIGALRQQLFSVANNQVSHSTIISLPNADGGIEQFEVVEASNFEPALQIQFPEIRAFSGKGITDRSATLKLSISPQGIQTMVFRTDKDNEFIEPYSNDHNIYAVFKSHREPGQLSWTCSTIERQFFSGVTPGLPNNNRIESSAGELKTMRLAQSCTGEYANFFGATSSAQVSNVLAAYNATLTRCNGVYEKDLALHLNLIAATTSVIYYTPSTDPYSPAAAGAGGAWNGELMNTLHSVLGDTAFDIGHLFGASGGGGNAGCIGCVCSNDMTTVGGDPVNYKGSGFTSPADAIPQGDNFDIDYVVHEVGHQLGANHTFSMSLEGTGVNKEVGSGITIMGYAGITSQDVAPHSIDIFHEASIDQIQNNLATKTCPVTTNITANNATPVVGSVSNYTIPISTPFMITGSATDANAGDVLTYCWEQNDNSTTSGANSVASPTKATGPNWLSFSPTTSPNRTFPKLSTILAGLNVTPPITGGDAGANIEALSSVSRTLNFRLTVRDNHPYSSTAPVAVGQTAYTNMAVTVTNTSGPFQVTSPNSFLSWGQGTLQTITWDVNNTTNAPVSCALVKISLSTDGGNTFPTVLSASTANDGSEVVTMPMITTSTARIKVEAVGNIFFDISNSNFAITGPCVGGLNGTYTVGTSGTYPTLTAAVNAYNTTCLNGPVVFELLDATYPGETFPIVINASGYSSATNTLTIQPASGVAATISGNPANALIKLNGADRVIIDGLNTGGSSLTLNNTNGTSAGIGIWIGSAGSGDGATNNTIRNCTINGNSGTTTLAGIVSSSGTTAGNAAETANSNNTIQGCTIKKCQNGIFVIGNATTLDQNWLITQNTIGSTVVAEKGRVGIALQNAQTFTISKNNVTGATSSSSSTASGVLVGSVLSGGNIFNNKIRDISNTNTVGWGSNGIMINTTSTAANVNVYNNFISEIFSYGYVTDATYQDNGYGIIINGGSGYGIYHNTVHMNTNQTINGLPAAFNVASGVTTVGAIDVRNNIFTNSQTVGTQRYSIYCAANKNVFSNINYNDYYTTGPNLGFLSANRSNLAAIQTGFGGNANSVNIQPAFISATDLHLSTYLNSSLDNTGTAIGSVTVDIDNDSRSTTQPDIGADEFAMVGTCPGSNVTYVSNISGAAYQWQVDIGAGFTNITDGAVYSGTTTNTLTLTAPPTSYNRYKYRCRVDVTNFSAVNTYKVAVTWTGATSTNWSLAGNWSCGIVPDQNTDVYINPAVPNYPAVNQNVTVRSLTTNAGASITIASGFMIMLTGL